MQYFINIFKSSWMKCSMKCSMNFIWLYTPVQHQPSNIHGFLFANSVCNRKLKVEAEQSLILVVLSELIDSDAEKSTRVKTRSWIKRRSVSGYFNNQRTEDRMAFEEMFWLSLEDFEFILKHTNGLLPPLNRMLGELKGVKVWTVK